MALVIWISPYELKKANIIGKAGEFRATAPASGELHPQEEWRKSEITRVSGESADLQDLHGRILKSTWADVEGLLSGTTADLPKDDPRYLRLLTWLHLDPPSDVEIRNRLPALLAAARGDSATLDLWEKLAYKGSPMEEAIRNGARSQLYLTEDKGVWSISQRETLQKLGWPTAP